MKYLATKTGNTLERIESSYYWSGKLYPTLLDRETGLRYDCPSDSYRVAMGGRSSLELGKIIPVQHGVKGWVTNLTISTGRAWVATAGGESLDVLGNLYQVPRVEAHA